MSSAKTTTVVKGVIWSFAEKVSAQLVSFLVSVVLARILSPDDYGLVSMILVFITISDVFVNSGFTSALVQRKNASTLDFSTVYYSSQVLSVLIYLIIFISSPLIASFYSRPELVLLLRVFALKIPIGVLNSVQHAYVSRTMQFKKFFYSSLVGVIVSGFVGICLASFGFGVWALIAQYISLTIVDTAVLFFTIKWHPTLEYSITEAISLMSYGWKILLSDLSGTFFGQLRSLVIGKVYSSADLAFYDKGTQIPSLVSNNLGNAVTSVLFPAMSNVSDDLPGVKSLCRKAMSMMAFVISPVMYGIAATADLLIVIIFTEKWAASIPLIRVLAIAYSFGTIGLVPLQAIKAIGRSDIVLRLEFVKKPVFVMLLGIGVRFGLLATAATMLIYEIYGFLVNSYELRKHLNYSLREQLADVIPSMLMSILMYLVVANVSLHIPSMGLLIIKMLIGIIAYIVLSIAFKSQSFLSLVSLINNFRNGR